MEKKRYKKSIIIGKFYPPHLGHIFMIETARSISENVIVLLYSLKSEKILGQYRSEALMEYYKNDPIVKIRWIEKEIPQDPTQHPQFWDIWKEDLMERIPRKEVDCIVGSENYIKTISSVLDIDYYMVDINRNIVPISGTICRNNFIENWDFMIPQIRHLFVKKFCFVGGESTGKSTLSRIFSKLYNTNYTEEYGRTYTKSIPPRELTSNEFLHIAGVQLGEESKLIKSSNKYLFCDTDPIVTQCFHIIYKGHRNLDIDSLIRKSSYSHYFLLAPTIPFVQDGTREFDDKRLIQYNLIKTELDRFKFSYTIVDEIDLNSRINLIKSVITQHI